MKKLFMLVLTMMLVLGGTIAFADQEQPVKPSTPQKFVMPAGTAFTVLLMGRGPTHLIAGAEAVITAVKIHEKVKNQLDPNLPPEDIVEFDLAYDQPKVKCNKHGSHGFETYAPHLGSTAAFVMKKDLKEYKK